MKDLLRQHEEGEDAEVELHEMLSPPPWLFNLREDSCQFVPSSL
jgi:hypothetical protein